MRIGVSGASGFVGRALARYVRRAGDVPCVISRGQPLPPCDTVIHCAGLAHRRATREEFFQANRDLTVELARASRDRGVKRFVFLSSIAVLAGHHDRTLAPDMSPRPTGPSGAAKAEAEEALRNMTGLESVILRPPVVYGPGARGNLASLMKVCRSKLPLPFAAVKNRRSMVGVTNLCSALHFLCRHGRPGGTYHVRDGEFSLSTLIATCRRAMGLAPRLFPVPPEILRTTLVGIGRHHTAARLLDDLVVDDASLREQGWRCEPNDDLERMAYEARS